MIDLLYKRKFNYLRLSKYFENVLSFMVIYKLVQYIEDTNISLLPNCNKSGKLITNIYCVDFCNIYGSKILIMEVVHFRMSTGIYRNYY